MASEIAYFSMGIGLKSSIPTYSGGLEILAGGHLKTAARMGIPMVGVSLFYNYGYFKQKLTDKGWQNEEYEKFNPSSEMERIDDLVEIELQNRKVNVGAWKYVLEGKTDIPIFFLDTCNCGNESYDEFFTGSIYNGYHPYHRICQEVILGIGGVKLLEKLGYDPKVYHMNEGHAAFLTLELLKRLNDVEKVKQKCVFTTHTPVEAGHDKFPYNDIYNVLPSYLPENIRELAGQDELNMTILAANMSRYINGVTKKHAEVCRNMEVFKGHEVDYITNGVFLQRWATKEFKQLYNKYARGWNNNPEKLRAVTNIPNELIWGAHMKAKKRLIDYVNYMNFEKKINFDIEKLTISFARRAAEYKRPDLIFRELDELIRIGKDKIQIIFAGKAHPADTIAKERVRDVYQHIAKLRENGINAVYLENYEIPLAKLMVAGSDVWLNTPRRPNEASGTSGMKAAVNGVLNFSILDGWFIETYMDGDINAWSIGAKPTEDEPTYKDEKIDDDDSNSLRKKLENKIIPLYPTFSKDMNGWTDMMKRSISTTCPYTNTQRMLKDYIQKAYLL